jgi:hypothetical protein
MPMDMSKYPADWKAISKRIREDRAGNKCEWCGVENKAYGARDRFDAWHDESEIAGMSNGTGTHYFGDYPKMIKVVLTVAHLNHDTTDNRDENLAALCQRCHLRHDAKHHAKNAAKTRRKNHMERTGQAELFAESER